MASDTRKFQVGIFVLGALTIGVVAAIWLGANRYFSDEITMVAYFSESIQGLDPGSDVKYRGVPAGRVESIGIAPDEELIEVTMSIKSNVHEVIILDETLRAQLQLSGITGLRYVEIDRAEGEALRKSPNLDFKPPYPVLSSTPSSFAAVQEALEAMYDNIMSVDLEGISDDVRTTLAAADNILRDDRVQRTLSSLAELSESAARVTANVERITRDIEVAPAVDELRGVTAEARGFLAELREEGLADELRGTLHEFGAVAQSAKGFIYNLQDTVDRLDRSLENLETLTNDLSGQPSRLLFSDPPPER